MEVKDIIDLVKAGFTKEEILQLSQAVPVQQDVPVQQETDEHEKASDLTSQEKQIEALNAAIGELSEKIRQMNLLGAVIPESSVKQTTSQDLIGKIINPYTKKEV